MAYVLTKSVVALCTHGGSARATVGLARVKLGGIEALGMGATFSVTGCPNQVSSAPFPCVSATIVKAAARLKSNGVPLLLEDSQALNTPTGASLTWAPSQVRVKAI